MAEVKRKRILYEEPDISIVNKLPNYFLENVPDNDAESYFQFVKYCKAHPAFAAKILLDIDLGPYQSVILDAMFNIPYFILVASRGGSKTFMLGVYAVLAAMLNQAPKIIEGTKIVITGGAYRQSKQIFKIIQSLWAEAPLFRECCLQKPTESNDRCHLTVGTSFITALPLGNGETIRGERANIILADEFACLDANTLIETNLGLVRIKDSFKYKEQIELINKDGIFEKPNKCFRTPMVDQYKITTKYGYGFTCSAKHKVLTTNGYKLAKDLSADDFIVCNNQYKFPTSNITLDNTEVNEDMAWFMGMLISEGTITQKYTLSITTTDKTTVEKTRGVIKRLGYNSKVYTREPYKDKRGWSCKESFEIRVHSKDLREKLLNLGLEKVTAHNKKIPWCILQSPKNIIASFLSGLFEGDGSAFLFQDRDKTRLGVAYYSVSEQLIDDLHVVLKKFDLLAYKTSRMSKLSDNLQWMLRLNGKYAYDAYNLFDVIRWKEIENIFHVHKQSENYGVTWDSSRNKFMSSPYYSGKYHYLGRFEILEDAKKAVFDFYKTRPDCLKVRSVEKLPDKNILYDYCLPKTHSFYGNGFVQHNSTPEEIFETVVAGFGAVSQRPIENMKLVAREEKLRREGLLGEFETLAPHKQNQIIRSGTAFYAFNHFAKKVELWKSIIRNKICAQNPEGLKLLKGTSDMDDDLLKTVDYKDYGVMILPYWQIPKGFMDEKMLASNRLSMSDIRFKMEYECIFPTDSDGFYKMSAINAASPRDEGEVLIELEGDPNCSYILGVDPARTTDNFAICVIKCQDNKRKLVYTWTMNNKDFHRGADKIRELMVKFNVAFIVMDKGGGGLAVSDILHQKEYLKDGEEPLWDINDKDHEDMDGLHVIELVDFTPRWISEANFDMQADISHKRLLFPYTIHEDMYGSDMEKIDELDEVFEEIELTKEEMSRIVVTATEKANVLHFDIPRVPGTPYERKDRYSAILLGNYGAKAFMGHGIATKKKKLVLGNWAGVIARKHGV